MPTTEVSVDARQWRRCTVYLFVSSGKERQTSACLLRDREATMTLNTVILCPDVRVCVYTGAGLHQRPASATICQTKAAGEEQCILEIKNEPGYMA